jgi:protein-ribulosamine 3-kinase
VTPSVLHGDLWSGNMATANGRPAVFDPAVYYGHSEAEFGMSWCASFGQAFYNAYFEVLPKSPGFEERRNLYLVYHYLNHYNLFGSSYLTESERLLRRLQKVMGL